jgi:hypothetical protein
MDLDALEDKARAYNARNVAIAAIAATSVDPANTGDAAMLQMLQPRNAYPVKNLGNVLGSAAEAIASIVQVPVEIAAQSVLAIAALVAQQFANISIDGRTYPLSLFFLTVAKSGDRKSQADKLARTAIDHYVLEERRNYRVAMAKYVAAVDAGDNLLPELPINPSVLCEEPSLEAIQKDLFSGRPSQGLFSDEGGQFFGGFAMKPENALKSMAGLSKFWDGTEIIRSRASKGESMVLVNRRLSLHLMVQPSVAADVLSNDMMIGQGILARFLIARPASIQGERPYSGANALDSAPLQKFNRLITKLLSNGFQADSDEGLTLDTIEVTKGSEAYIFWVDFYNDIEEGIKDTYSHVAPAASKIAEQALRIAGVLAVIDECRTVSLTHMTNACCVAKYYINSQVATEAFIALGQNEKALEALRVLLVAKHRHQNIACRKLVSMMTAAMGNRSSARLRVLMKELEEEGFVSITKYSSQKGNPPTEWYVDGFWQ